MTTSTVRVSLPDRAYDVVIGAEVLASLGALVPLPPHARNAAVVTVESVAERYARPVAESLRDAGLRVTTITVPDGEAAKTLATVEQIYRALADLPLGRDDLLVAVGGGVVGDMAGFAAATWHRGVPVVQVPTTLLAQVDSAVGGKTGVNLSSGKNLVGAFHQPIGVVADIATLATLPARELRAGLGEVAKYGFIADPRILTLLETDPERALAGDPDLLTEIVRRSVAVKAEVVGADERESGRRALLNYGHTFGHAFESLTDYRRYRHGEAVALGMVAAARLSEAIGVAQEPLSDRTVRLLGRLGLPTGGLALDADAVWSALRRDKKARGGVRFVLCERPGVARLVDQPPREIIDEVLRSLGGTPALH